MCAKRVCVCYPKVSGVTSNIKINVTNAPFANYICHSVLPLCFSRITDGLGQIYVSLKILHFIIIQKCQ